MCRILTSVINQTSRLILMAARNDLVATDARNYREPSDEDLDASVQQLVNGALTLENYAPIRKLERIQQENNQALARTDFSSQNEKRLAESLQRNTNGWIETAKDALDVAVNLAGLGTMKYIANHGDKCPFFSDHMCTSCERGCSFH